MLTEMVEYGHKIEEKMKAMKSETKGTNSDRKKTRTQLNGLEQKEDTVNQNRLKNKTAKK